MTNGTFCRPSWTCVQWLLADYCWDYGLGGPSDGQGRIPSMDNAKSTMSSHGRTARVRPRNEADTQICSTGSALDDHIHLPTQGPEASRVLREKITAPKSRLIFI